MIVNCENCSAALQIDEKKAPTDRFTIRCPKCQNLVRVVIPKAGNAAPQVEKKPAANPQAIFEQPEPSPFEAPNAAPSMPATNDVKPGESPDLAALLSALMQQAQGATMPNKTVLSFAHKRVAVCLEPDASAKLSRLLAESGYQPLVLENPTQVSEKIRDRELDILVFASNFSVPFNGAAVIQKLLLSLNPTERRRLFVVSIEDTLQTYSTQEAFLRNVNLIVNKVDLPHLPSVLYRSLREYNDLYRFFNQALAEAV